MVEQPPYVGPYGVPVAPPSPAAGTTITVPPIGAMIRKVITNTTVQVAAVLLAFGGYQYYEAHKDGSGPDRGSAVLSATAARKLGVSYAPDVAAALADGWDAAASTLEAGKTVAEAQSSLQDAFKASRTRAFNAKVVPDFNRVLPEGQEPQGSVQRGEVATTWRAFARGLRGVK